MDGFWKDKRVFITGGNGFLGSHLTRALIQRGARPVVLIFEPNPGGVFEQENLGASCDLIDGDICDLPLMERILAEHKIDTVFHLAAQAIVDQAVDDPLATFEANIRGTWNILEAAKKRRAVERIIIASSDKAYGEHDALPYQEHTHHLKAAYPYEVSKTCADLISQSFAKAFGLPLVITRCGNLYGPGDLKMNRIVPGTILRLFHGRQPMIRDTGASLRDYVYIDDAVDGYLALAEQMQPSLYGEAFNFSMNAPVSVAEAIAVITREMSSTLTPEVVQTRGLEIRHQYAAYDKAKRLLGWDPKHTFEEGIKKTVPWYTEHFTRVHGAA